MNSDGFDVDEVLQYLDRLAAEVAARDAALTAAAEVAIPDVPTGLPGTGPAMHALASGFLHAAAYGGCLEIGLAMVTDSDPAAVGRKLKAEFRSPRQAFRLGELLFCTLEPFPTGGIACGHQRDRDISGVTVGCARWPTDGGTAGELLAVAQARLQVHLDMLEQGAGPSDATACQVSTVSGRRHSSIVASVPVQEPKRSA